MEANNITRKYYMICTNDLVLAVTLFCAKVKLAHKIISHRVQKNNLEYYRVKSKQRASHTREISG